jgi:hypothetical protein
MFAVDDIEDIVARLQTHGAETRRMCQEKY